MRYLLDVDQQILSKMTRRSQQVDSKMKDGTFEMNSLGCNGLTICQAQTDRQRERETERDREKAIHVGLFSRSIRTTECAECERTNERTNESGRFIFTNQQQLTK